MKVKGAVQAMPLITILRKLQEETIDITATEEELLIKGRHRRSGIRMEANIVLEVESVEAPKKWLKLPDDFADAVSMVQECAGKMTSSGKAYVEFIHLHPKWLEATDNYQIGRYKIKMGIEKSMLIRKDSLKHIVSLDMIKFSRTKNWMHFKNSSGLILSCRREVEDFPPNTSKALKMEGTPTHLPKGLKEAAEKAAVFSSENPEDNQVVINLQKGKLKITGKGASGWFSEIKKIKYSGQSMRFTISPELLIKLVLSHNKCEIAIGRLKVDVGKFSYVTVLGTADEKEGD